MLLIYLRQSGFQIADNGCSVPGVVVPAENVGALHPQCKVLCRVLHDGCQVICKVCKRHIAQGCDDSGAAACRLAVVKNGLAEVFAHRLGGVKPFAAGFCKRFIICNELLVLPFLLEALTEERSFELAGSVADVELNAVGVVVTEVAFDKCRDGRRFSAQGQEMGSLAADEFVRVVKGADEYIYRQRGVEVQAQEHGLQPEAV